jgi:thiamine-phosphate pyrophosphorylase
VPVVAEGAITRELISQLSPITDFIAIGAEIWAEENPVEALAKLWLP